ncbi:hydrolase [candidate division SR1 bacterium]|nr:hydrolase [candidate division SR1 bacterium]
MLISTYLYHSGFVIETDNSVLIFDYYRNDPANGSISDGVINQKFFESTNKPIIVFVSHSHYDHFNPVIFEWSQFCPDITYILSADLPPLAKLGKNRVVISPFQNRKIEKESGLDLTVISIPATDAGNAYLVKVDGMSFYHSGDHANRVRTGDPKAQSEWMTQTYLNELRWLFMKVSTPINLAFVPVIAPFEGDYLSSLDLMIRHYDPKIEHIVPIHLGHPGVDLLVMMSDIFEHALEMGYGEKLLTYNYRGEKFYEVV